MTRQNVVNAKKLVIDEALHKIKHTPAREYRSRKGLAGPMLRLMIRGSKQQDDADDGENPHGKVKESVLRVLALHVLDRRCLTSSRRTDHVMPAENLMEDDAIKEAAQAKAENGARANEWSGIHT